MIRPDETVVIRVAKSEMGQGTITGLAQLVAEELECDWSKVAIEYPTPGQNLARKQVWGTMFTAGSRRHQRIAGTRAQGRRRSSSDAGPGCCEFVERSRFGV